eukprot:1353878-Amorphochlora_amoeboformis.AAC.1
MSVGFTTSGRICTVADDPLDMWELGVRVSRTKNTKPVGDRDRKVKPTVFPVWKTSQVVRGLLQLILSVTSGRVARGLEGELVADG